MTTKESLAKEWLRIEEIELHRDLQPRVEVPPGAIKEYAELVTQQIEKNPEDPWPFREPVTVIEVGGAKFLTSGWTRLEATKEAGQGVVWAEVRKGKWIDAVVSACSANADHGYRRTHKDKRRAVEILLRHVTEEGESWSDTRIAEECLVSVPLVANVREALEQAGEIAQSEKRIGSNGKQYTAPKVRKSVKPKPEAVEPPKERTATLEDCPVCGVNEWLMTDSGYECNSCGHPHGEPAGLSGDEEWRQSDWQRVDTDYVEADAVDTDTVDTDTVVRTVVKKQTLERAKKSLATLTKALGEMQLGFESDLRAIHDRLQQCDSDG